MIPIREGFALKRLIICEADAGAPEKNATSLVFASCSLVARSDASAIAALNSTIRHASRNILHGNGLFSQTRALDSLARYL